MCSVLWSAGKKKRGPALMTKVLKKKKLRRARKRAPLMTLQPGQTVVVETLSTSSVADVVWQVRKCELASSDGSVSDDSGFLGHALLCWVSSSWSHEGFYCLHYQGQGVLELLHPEGRGCTFLQSVGNCSWNDTVLHPTWLVSMRVSFTLSWYVTVCKLTAWHQALDIRPHWTENCRLKNLRKQQVFFSATAFRLVQGPISLLVFEYSWYKCWSVRLASHFHLVASLRLYRAIPPLQTHGHSMTLKYRASAPFTFS